MKYCIKLSTKLISDQIWITFKSATWRSCHCIPEPDSIIIRGRGKELAILWECHCIDPRWMTFKCLHARAPSLLSSYSIYRLPKPPIAPNWKTIVPNYCGRNLRHSTDKLPALAGLARRCHLPSSVSVAMRLILLVQGWWEYADFVFNPPRSEQTSTDCLPTVGISA